MSRAGEPGFGPSDVGDQRQEDCILQAVGLICGVDGKRLGVGIFRVFVPFRVLHLPPLSPYRGHSL